MTSDFWIAWAKFGDYHDTAVDWLILSWSKKGVDKEIALLYHKKYSQKAFKELRKVNKYVNL